MYLTVGATLVTLALCRSIGRHMVARDDPPSWAIDGRPLPTPEFLQPPIDSKLPDFVPCSDVVAINSVLTGSVPAILPQLVLNWLGAFSQIYPYSYVRAPPPYLAPQGNLSAPLQAFLDGYLDFAFLSRDLSTADIASFKKSHNGLEPLSIPIVGGAYQHFGFVDAVALIVNSANPVKHLDYTQLDGIFSKSYLRGHAPVMTWGDVNVTSNNFTKNPVHIVGASAWNGEESARAITIRQNILSVNNQHGIWRTDIKSNGTEADVPAQIAADPYAIGFTGLGHLVDGVKPIAISDNRNATAPFYDPSYENIARGEYPLARVAYLLVAKTPGQPINPTLRELLRFILSKDGQQIALDQAVFLPLRASAAKAAMQLLDGAGMKSNYTTSCSLPWLYK